MNDRTPLAVVTGANRGLGFEVCRQLGQRGFRIALTGRDRAKGTTAAARLSDEGFSVRYLPLDVAEPDSIAVCQYRLNVPQECRSKIPHL